MDMTIIRFVTLGVAIVGFTLGLFALIMAYFDRRELEMRNKAINILAASLYKERGDCKVAHDGLVIFIKRGKHGLHVTMGMKADPDMEG